MKFLMPLLFSLSSFALSEYATPFELVDNAYCKEELASDYKIEKSVEKLLANGNEKYQSTYFKFQNESQDSISIFRRLVKDHVLKKIINHKDFKTRISKARQCISIKCALTHLFEEDELIAKTIYLINEYELNTSAYSNIDAGIMSKEELDIVLETVSLIPKSFFLLKNNKRLVKHIKEGIGYRANGMIFANASIELYTPWERELDNKGKVYTLLHEFAHNLGYPINMGYNQEWWKLSNWIDHPMGWRYDRSRMISGYGATNPGEDAAESIVAYRLNPKKLKSISMAKYNFIKNEVFKGYEFNSPKDCL